MIKMEHPFYKVCQDMIRERYPNQTPALSGKSPLASIGIPDDVAAEALKRIYGEELRVIIPGFWIKHGK